LKHVTCADLVPHCTAQFRGDSTMAVVELYAKHARSEHQEPVQVIDLMLSITAA
jgi:predicted small metal-binding protein